MYILYTLYDKNISILLGMDLCGVFFFVLSQHLADNKFSLQIWCCSGEKKDINLWEDQ